MNTPLRVVVLASMVGLGATLIAQSVGLPPEKQVIEQTYAQERSTGTQNPAPKDPSTPFPIAPSQPFPVGILDECDPSFASAEASISNCWAGNVGGTNTIVYAGTEGTEGDPSHGLVYVVGIPGYPADPNGTRVVSPVVGGPLRIVAAGGSTLTLVSSTGRFVLTFDVTTRMFTSVITDSRPTDILGMPTPGCMLWPQDKRLVRVATLTASDDTIVAPGTFTVTANSSQPIGPNDPQYPDIVITQRPEGGYTVDLKADRSGSVSEGRVYRLTATATDVVGNVALLTSTCTVPHDQGK